ncbi:MAG: hypothetical protein HFI41_03780 [Lachnospiraceae bacterium]|nr:hypothetical protein [Lachnospiraceae bacterium]
MKKNMVVAMLTTLAIGVSVFTGCGDTNKVANTGTQAGMDSINKVVTDTTIIGDVEPNTSEEAVKPPVADTGIESAEKKTEDATKNEATKPVEKKAEDKKATNTQKPEESKTSQNNNPTQTTQMPARNEGVENTGETSEIVQNTQKPVDGLAKPTNPNPAPEPVHEHSWKAHTATKQEWVPNIVKVDDYRKKPVVVGYQYECECGATFSSREEGIAHSTAHIEEGASEVMYTCGDVYEEQEVLVGSHEEDHGYYKDVTYTDYEYCDCGATR